MSKFLSFLVGKMLHSVGMPSCSSESLPETDFDFCDPNIRLSEIKRIFLSKISAEEFVDWSDADEWRDRISEFSMDNNAIRPLTCIADKPAPTGIKKNISSDRKKTTSKTHVINVTIDEVSDINHEFIKSLKGGKRYRVWYETMGGYMFGGNNGIHATVFGEMVLPRGQGEIMTYEVTITWESLRTEDRIESPIFDDSLPEIHTPLIMELALYPQLKIEFVSNHVDGWEIQHKLDSGFRNINPLIAAYPIPLTVRAHDEVDFLATGDPGTSEDFDESIVISEPTRKVQYLILDDVPYESSIYGYSSKLVYTILGDTTVEFEDILGNTARWSPLISFPPHIHNAIAEYLIANVAVELVDSTDSTATIRMTRTHEAPNDARFGNMTMTWISSDPLLEDPAHIGDDDIRLITLGTGYHTFAVETKYKNTDYIVDYPKSYMSFVIWVH